MEIEADITVARTLPSAVYREVGWYERVRERVLGRSWHLLGDAAEVPVGHAVPGTLLPGCLDEPYVITNVGGTHRVLSNVCTHRGNIVCGAAGPAQGLRCRYHGRRFSAEGRCLSMPEFEGVVGFPGPSDDLPSLQLGRWSRFLFGALAPAFSLEEAMAPLEARLGWMPIESFVPDPAGARTFHIKANWILYCDNYLEGFHIPFVHKALDQALDYGSYRTELFPRGSLQIGVAQGDDDTFFLPDTSPDAGTAVAAYYFWVFPNLMFNFYPWGLSVNVVEPLGPSETRVRFLPFVWDEARRNVGAGAGLDRVEEEDEEVVEAVQRGVRSRMYDRGRYSPTRETGVHHFHRLLAERLA
jgi:choline monooxygenase